MTKKEITVTWSTTVTVDVPDNFSFETVESAYAGGQTQNAELVVGIIKEAYDNIGWRDGDITDIQDATIFAED